MRERVKRLDNTSNNVIVPKPEFQKKYNRTELRRVLGGATKGRRSNSPRCIASRKPLPMPENWKGWRNWTPKKKKAV